MVNLRQQYVFMFLLGSGVMGILAMTFIPLGWIAILGIIVSSSVTAVVTAAFMAFIVCKG